VFLLVLFRIGGLMLAAPIFSSAIFPTQVRILLAMAITAAVFPLVSASATVPVTVASAIGGLVGELAIGLLIGFSLSLMFMGVQLAAEFISQGRKMINSHPQQSFCYREGSQSITKLAQLCRFCSFCTG
jgi:flagellar biosynthetic protein FliR